jgi:hypothetical protein
MTKSVQQLSNLFCVIVADPATLFDLERLGSQRLAHRVQRR